MSVKAVALLVEDDMAGESHLPPGTTYCPVTSVVRTSSGWVEGLIAATAPSTGHDVLSHLLTLRRLSLRYCPFACRPYYSPLPGGHEYKSAHAVVTHVTAHAHVHVTCLHVRAHAHVTCTCACMHMHMYLLSTCQLPPGLTLTLTLAPKPSTTRRSSRTARRTASST